MVRSFDRRALNLSAGLRIVGAWDWTSSTKGRWILFRNRHRDVMMAIRAPYGHRNRNVKVAKSYKTPRETGLLILGWAGFLVPLIWVASPAFWFAEYPLRTGPLVAGVMCFVIGLRLFYRSHADLGTNWSITLEVRERRRLRE